MFGSKLAPYIFNLFTEALHWAIQWHIPAALRHYLDNFLPIFKPLVSSQHANMEIDWIEDLGKELGLSFQPKKTIRLTTCLEFLGLELDSAAMEACLPQEKLHCLRETLGEWQVHRHCTLWDIQELTGFLQFCT